MIGTNTSMRLAESLHVSTSSHTIVVDQCDLVITHKPVVHQSLVTKAAAGVIGVCGWRGHGVARTSYEHVSTILES
jgi:hypothetical protein